MNKGELILYRTEDGAAQIELRAANGTVWLTQAEIAELFDTTKQNVSLHLKNIFSEGELTEISVVKESLTTAADGKQYKTNFYNLKAILAIGFRVRSPRGVQFRRWANTILREYLVKGFAMDDAKLKQADQGDYFDELLARIRDIRASEKRFYQKICDIYATAVDYDKKSDEARQFFQKVQNKMLWAIVGHTAAEIIGERSDADAPNMGLTAFAGSRVRKADIDIAKNYLQKDEIDELNRIVVMYLDYAEDQAKRRKTISMAQWSDKLDAFLQFNERPLLTNAGTVSAAVAKKLAAERYAIFDAKRKRAEALAADAADIKELEALEKSVAGKLVKAQERDNG